MASAFETRPWADVTSSLVAGYLVFSYPFALGVALPHGGAFALATILAIAPPAFVALTQLCRVLTEIPVLSLGMVGTVGFGFMELPLLLSPEVTASFRESAGWYVAAFCLTAVATLFASLNFYWEAGRDADAHVASLRGKEPAARGGALEVVAGPTEEPVA